MESFVCDRMLGKLSKWLRMLGYDTIYIKELRLDYIIKMIEDGKFFLTRDKKLQNIIKNKRLVFIESDYLYEQLNELIEKIDLKIEKSRFFTRCNICNEKIKIIPRSEVEGKVPDFIFHTHTNFSKCPKCGRIYWEGTHYNKTLDKIYHIFKKRNFPKNSFSN